MLQTLSKRPAHLTPSGFKKIMTNGRGGDSFGKTALSYVDEVVMKIIGVEQDDFTSYEMQWGIDNEPFAVEAYQDYKIAEVHSRNERFVHSDYDFISGEVDGLVGEEGGIEVKCPNSNNHLSNLIEAAQLSQYMYQIQGYMWITNRQWWDFVSYDPRFPKEYRLSVNRVVRDESVISELEVRCEALWGMVQKRLDQIRELK